MGNSATMLNHNHPAKKLQGDDFYESKCKKHTIIYISKKYSRIIMKIESLNIHSSKISQFKKKGIETIEELIDFVPRKYLDYRKPVMYSEFKDGDNVSVIGTVKQVNVNEAKNYCKVTVFDDELSHFDIFWFGNTGISNTFKLGWQYIFCGKVSRSSFNYKYTMSNPLFSSNIESMKVILPIYSKIKGMSDQYLKQCIDKALNSFIPNELLEPSIITKYNLCYTAEKNFLFHKPSTLEDIERAKNRMVFDELFHLAIEMERNHVESIKSTDIRLNSLRSIKPFLDTLPFPLTDGEGGQLETVRSIIRKINKGFLTNSLVQGDVGVGKTLVAFLLMMAFAENGYQSVLMAPTTVLASQHYKEVLSYSKQNTYIKPVLLTSGLKAKERRDALKKIESGQVNVIIGTNSLISECVQFSNLGLCIVDEEHRFGVTQRDKIKSKFTSGSHAISMSATPIPRTLGLSLYGDGTDIYTITKRPVGRKNVITSISTNIDDSYNFVRQELSKGRQAYIICPLIEESKSERLDGVESVEETYQFMKRRFANDPCVKIAMVNGKMKRDEVSTTIQKFADKEYNVIISTTIIEVGVNVPNATVILIKNSERFGLAQLHQLRGRVGRGDQQSYCILASIESDVPRLNIMTQTTDGFKIAEEDIKLRGMGDFLGTRQSGDSKNVLLMLMNQELYKKIKEDVKEIYNSQDRRNYYYNNGF